MKVSQLALAGILSAALTSTIFAQSQMGYGAYPSGQGYAQPAMAYSSGPGYPGAMPAAYSMSAPPGAEAPNGPPMPMDGQGPAGMAGPMDMQGAGPDGCATCGSGGARGCEDDMMPHYWYFDAELFYARRTVTHEQTLITNTEGTVANNTDLEFPYSPGLRTTIGFMFRDAVGIEGTLWGYNDFKANRTDNSASDLTFPGDLGTEVFTGSDQMQTQYDSRITNVEMNIVFPYGNIQFLAGFRAMQLDERLNILATGGSADDLQYLITTRNRLYGGQIGTRGQWKIGLLGIDAQAKAGLFGDASNQTNTVNDLDLGTSPRDASTNAGKVSFVGDVGAYGNLPLGSIFTVRGGYTATWIAGTVLAPDQFDTTNTPTSGTGINTHGNMIVHGFNIGLDARW